MEQCNPFIGDELMLCLSQPSISPRRVLRHARADALVISCLLTMSPALADSQFTVVHQFTSNRTDGGNPIDGLIKGTSGKLFGVTFQGGKNPLRCLINGSTSQCGTVFELSAPKGGRTEYKEKPIHRFSGGDGFEPSTRLVSDSSGALYGATLSGSGNEKNCSMSKGFECGVVYKLTPPADGSSNWTVTVLHRFSDVGEAFKGGYHLLGGLVVDDTGALIGITSSGGSRSNHCSDTFAGCGVVFRLTPPAGKGTMWDETVLYTFGDNGPIDAEKPDAAIVMDAKGAIYGTTQFGGPGIAGTVWKLTPPSKGQSSWTESIVHGFSGPDGIRPFGPVLIDARGAIYGASIQGGPDQNCATGVFTCGVVYKLTPPRKGQTAWTETVLHEFGSQNDGASPDFGLVADASGNLFGTTGNGPGNNGVLGTVFELSPPTGKGKAWTEKVLHTFTGGSDGKTPSGGLVLSNGALFGMAESGGDFLGGTLFMIEP
jgi:hypothetical protein